MALTQTQPHIGMLREKSLHASVKTWYARPEDRLETSVNGYVIDIVRDDDLLVEIQTRSFAPLKTKLRKLTVTHRVRLVHPIAVEKWILKTWFLGSLTIPFPSVLTCKSINIFF